MVEKPNRAEIEQALKVMNSVLGVQHTNKNQKKRDFKKHEKAKIEEKKDIKAQKTVEIAKAVSHDAVFMPS